MNAERWKKVAELYEALLEQPEEKHAAFLTQACGEDEELRREVEEMLKARKDAGSFLGQPAAEQLGLAPEPKQGKSSLVGKRLGVYEIEEWIGAGGMGEVYRARDTRLDRMVAIKILPPHWTKDAEHLKRFRREARAASALNHPHIVTIYEIDEADGVHFIAMEYVDGKKLDQLIPRHGMRLNEALKVAVQMADALAAAHEAGIVHRDLKPGNLMVTGKGQVKVLDFGLAKLMHVYPAPEAASSSNLPTATAQDTELTGPGMVLGTLHYMSPEQAMGMELDARSDIFSFGSVLYEMVSGKRAFEGDSKLSTLGTVINKEPEPLTGRIPHDLDKVISRCLRKDPARRFQFMQDVRVELEELKEESDSGKLAGVLETNVGPRPRVSRWITTALTVALVSLMVTGVILWRRGSGDRQPSVMRKLSLTLPEGANGPVISPNGQHVAFLQQGKLWVRDLDQDESRELPGTTGAESSPFWSPDSRMIGYRSGENLRTVPMNGGPFITVCKLPGNYPLNFSGTWSPDGQIIVFSSGILGSVILYQVLASGGSPQALEYPHSIADVGPVFLPSDSGQRKLLYGAWEWLGKDQLKLLDLQNGKSKVLGLGFPVAFSRSGFILANAVTPTGDLGVLWARPFSLASEQFTGEAFPIVQEASEASLSSDDTLVYVHREGNSSWQLFWRDRRGKRLGSIGQLQTGMYDPALSPDWKQVAVAGIEEERDIWIHDTKRPLKTRLTFGQEGRYAPLWLLKGDRVAFVPGEKVRRFLVKPVDGSKLATPLPGAPECQYCYFSTKSADDQYFLYLQGEPNGARDIWYLEMQGNKQIYKSVRFMQTPFDERGGELSPDKRFIVYASNESGQFEVYVRNFPSGTGKWQVSRSGGIQPRWGKDGKEIYYVLGRTLMAAPVKTQPGFSLGEPEPLFDSDGFRGDDPLIAQYDTAPDGRFVTQEQVGNGSKSTIRVVENWHAGYRKQQK